MIYHVKFGKQNNISTTKFVNHCFACKYVMDYKGNCYDRRNEAADKRRLFQP